MATSWTSRRTRRTRTETAPGRAPALPGALRVLLFAALAVPLLRRLPPAGLRRLGPRPRPGARLDGSEAAALSQRIDRWLAAGRPWVRPGCLTRGIARYWFLRRAGADVELRFGLLRSAEGGVAGGGHCWLTLAGEPLGEPRDPRELYIETFRLPGGDPQP
jgi:transglutaminase superfamily protein